MTRLTQQLEAKQVAAAHGRMVAKLLRDANQFRAGGRPNAYACMQGAL